MNADPTFLELREAYGTREHTAKASGCGTPLIRLIERGYQPTSPAIRRGLAAAFKIDEDALTCAITQSGLAGLPDSAR